MKVKVDKKAVILDAASQVVEEQGAGHLTIDAVAETAGLSKGGVLHHFPNKHALLSGMLDRVIESQKRRTSESGSPFGGVHAHVTATVEKLPKDEWTSALAILAAAAENPDLLSNARLYMRELLDELKGTPQFADAMLAIVAAEGLRIMDALTLLPFTTQERKLFKDKLMALAEAASS